MADSDSDDSFDQESILIAKPTHNEVKSTLSHSSRDFAISDEYSSHNNGNINNDVIKIKNWGTKYKVYSTEYPIIFNINERYKPMIEKYIDFEQETKLINQYILQKILKNGIIMYHQYNNNNNYKKIDWNKDR